MTLYHKEQGKSLYDALIDSYEKVWLLQRNISFLELKGKEGSEKLQNALIPSGK